MKTPYISAPRSVSGTIISTDFKVISSGTNETPCNLCHYLESEPLAPATVVRVERLHNGFQIRTYFCDTHGQCIKRVYEAKNTSAPVQKIGAVLNVASKPDVKLVQVLDSLRTLHASVVHRIEYDGEEDWFLNEVRTKLQKIIDLEG